MTRQLELESRSGGGRVGAKSRSRKPGGYRRSLSWGGVWSEDRRGGHRGPAGCGVSGCSFLFWLMKS